MFVSETRIRVRYSETDQMGVVYYGHYAQYFEVGRAEAIREMGWTYKQLEETGILMPVVSLQVRYHRPARYDDLLLVRTQVNEPPARLITFSSMIFNDEGVHLTSGEVSLTFIDKKTGRPCPAPDKLISTFESFFS